MNTELQTTINKLSLGFSPCPNDCFIFEAMIHGKIDTEGLEFDVVMADVEELNRRTAPPNFPKREENKTSQLDITKVSFARYMNIAYDYVLLNAGAALGFGVGPLLISKNPINNQQLTINDLKIAIPGKYTTANFLFSLAFPDVKNRVEMLFSDIEDAVLLGKVDAGVIIHENRFTYQQKGLHKIIDLGEWWETQTQSAIPLGGIVMKRNFSDDIKQKVNRVLRKSVEYAFANPKSSMPFVKAHAQELSEEVMYKHIDLYVNKYSVDLGDEGKKAIKTMFDKAIENKVIEKINSDIFCPS